MQQLRRRRPRPPLHQLDLCLASPLPDSGGAQRWSTLPDQTRQTLSDLLTLLLIAHTAAGARAGRAPRRATAMSADKIGAQHRARKAVLYVRQSSAHQVQHNRDSRVLQYAMRDRLVQLVWSEMKSSMRTSAARQRAEPRAPASSRMVAEVCPGKVGALAAREVWRSRASHATAAIGISSSRCRVVDTLLVDQEAVYAPRQGNVRQALR